MDVSVPVTRMRGKAHSLSVDGRSEFDDGFAQVAGRPLSISVNKIGTMQIKLKLYNQYFLVLVSNTTCHVLKYHLPNELLPCGKSQCLGVRISRGGELSEAKLVPIAKRTQVDAEIRQSWMCEAV